MWVGAVAVAVAVAGRVGVGEASVLCGAAAGCAWAVVEAARL